MALSSPTLLMDLWSLAKTPFDALPPIGLLFPSPPHSVSPHQLGGAIDLSSLQCSIFSIFFFDRRQTGVHSNQKKTVKKVARISPLSISRSRDRPRRPTINVPYRRTTASLHLASSTHPPKSRDERKKNLAATPSPQEKKRYFKKEKRRKGKKKLFQND